MTENMKDRLIKLFRWRHLSISYKLIASAMKIACPKRICIFLYNEHTRSGEMSKFELSRVSANTLDK